MINKTIKPILFNTEDVKAILDGKKNKTTRVFSKTQLKYFDYAQKLGEMSSLDNLHENDFAYILQFSQYKVGDVLWVREPVKVTKACNDTLKMEFEYLSDGTKKIIDIPKKYLDEYDFIKNNCFLAKLNQLHYDKKYVGVPNGCLKEMARIFLKVTNVKFERKIDIGNKDLKFVFVYEFEKVEKIL